MSHLEHRRDSAATPVSQNRPLPEFAGRLNEWSGYDFPTGFAEYWRHKGDFRVTFPNNIYWGKRRSNHDFRCSDHPNRTPLRGPIGPFHVEQGNWTHPIALHTIYIAPVAEGRAGLNDTTPVPLTLARKLSIAPHLQ